METTTIGKEDSFAIAAATVVSAMHETGRIGRHYVFQVSEQSKVALQSDYVGVLLRDLNLVVCFEGNAAWIEKKPQQMWNFNLVDGKQYRVTLFPPLTTIGTFIVTVRLRGIDLLIEFKNGQSLLIARGLVDDSSIIVEEIK